MRPVRATAREPTSRIGEDRQRRLDIDAMRSSFQPTHRPSHTPRRSCIYGRYPSCPVSLDDVRASVKRVQTEGRKLVTQLRKDASALAKRRPLDLVDDAQSGPPRRCVNCRRRGARAGSSGEHPDSPNRQFRAGLARRKVRAEAACTARAPHRASRKRPDRPPRPVRETPGGSEPPAARRLDADPISRPHSQRRLSREPATSAAVHEPVAASCARTAARQPVRRDAASLAEQRHLGIRQELDLRITPAPPR
jgi:hypothetical protein